MFWVARAGLMVDCLFRYHVGLVDSHAKPNLRAMWVLARLDSSADASSASRQKVYVSNDRRQHVPHTPHTPQYERPSKEVDVTRGRCSTTQLTTHNCVLVQLALHVALRPSVADSPHLHR